MMMVVTMVVTMEVMTAVATGKCSTRLCYEHCDAVRMQHARMLLQGELACAGMCHEGKKEGVVGYL
jgi:hypothetical protein